VREKVNGRNIDLVFSEKIKERIESNTWDREIASRVLSAIKRRRRRLITASSLTSLATAATIVLAFIFTLHKPTTSYEIDQLISLQLDGTYRSVFNKGYHESLPSILSNKLPSDDIDALIDETLTMR
jgi:hypothetical protein